MKYYLYTLISLSALSCSSQKQVVASPEIIKPVIVTEPVNFDSDDPAIWVNSADPSKSLVIGTDKDINGGLFVFNLEGKIQKDLSVTGLKRPNNVDIAYGLMLNGKKTDIAVTTERYTHKLRVFSLPDMKPIDNGGLPMFEGQTGEGERDLMGIALYTDPKGNIYAITGRKTGPKDGSYLWQYLLSDSGKGFLEAKLVRKFGNYSGKKEIESIAVDNENGYVYYSDEQFGVRKYYADPDKGNQELGVFAQTGFTEDHEGISIYKTKTKKGYILVSDQGANKFHIFSRDGKNKLLKIVKVMANKSDGSDMVSIPLNKTFRHGLFVVMSDDKTFHYYRWEDIAGEELDVN
ncbi:phytase [Elizabethkingia sp. HX WHF]|uniref:phytase n=1 Tax=Elizabethkingia TaxID=308865 RepID=UPI00099ACAEB|nr:MULTISPECIES: phytase [Elizabethkingia]ATL42304.1 3-phytase [Elizabethkingia miricola]MCL1638960.1 phytase [Elizabethkingia bruuniana]MDX8562930.1 phytase [Elizabethkingia sp. HX WHF]OPC22393.1 3-phytase [Elizabethkingia bruuniana]